MKLIKLTQGKFAMVDDWRYEKLNQYKWHASLVKKNIWYARREVNGRGIYMHREIMGCTKGDGKMIDHLDRNSLNCQQANMRFCNYLENNDNRKIFDKVKFKGVSKRKNRWIARIYINKKQKHLGSSKTEKGAAKIIEQYKLKKALSNGG